MNEEDKLENQNAESLSADEAGIDNTASQQLVEAYSMEINESVPELPSGQAGGITKSDITPEIKSVTWNNI